MEIIRTISALRQRITELRTEHLQHSKAAKVGFIPTMGYLHQGHASLMRTARSHCSIVVLSIFVNPMQFGPNEDFERYPRDTNGDLKLSGDEGVDIVFMPSVAEMYPDYPLRTKVGVSDITSRLCGASRPGHFDGVATVVMKLLNIVLPDEVFFGLKDAQQVAVIEQMVGDLNMPVKVVPCATVREPDGLAMSSRNVYLDAEERQQAVVLSEALHAVDEMIGNGDITFDDLRSKVERHIMSAPLASIDYIEVLTYPSLQTILSGTKIRDQAGKDAFIVALAVRFGKTRLIDNRIMNIKGVDSDVKNDDEVENTPRHSYGSKLILCGKHHYR